MNVARSRQLRKLWIALDTRATNAKRNIGRNVLTNSDDFWTHRAHRWAYWAGVAHWYLKQEVGLTDEHQNQTRNDFVDTNQWQIAERRRQAQAHSASARSAAIVGGGWDIDTEDAYETA